MLQPPTSEQENILLGKLQAEGINVVVSVSPDLMESMCGPCASSGGTGGSGTCGGGSCNQAMPK